MHCASPFAALAGLLLLSATSLAAQGTLLDVLDGETLYENGYLLTLGQELVTRDTLRTGRHRVDNPLQQSERLFRTTTSLQYGLRYDLQIGVAVDYVSNSIQAIGLDETAEGLSDVTLMVKYRFLRFDGKGFATNFALLGGVSLPTGDDNQQSDTGPIDPDLQPGSGSFDPLLGVAVTHEPGRWRFNAAAIGHWRTDSDANGNSPGSDVLLLLEIGNRFWLEPYPGPFMRLDLVLRYFYEDQAREQSRLPDTGYESTTIGLNWAFRPRPSLDFQLYVETPISQQVNGTQLADDWRVDFTFGYRF
ncbi:MAG: transporter [Planctomycetes bacterium]|nr:transporter [Planctomycetota bacterium]